jgi:hypothetical protein
MALLRENVRTAFDDRAFAYRLARANVPQLPVVVGNTVWDTDSFYGRDEG